MGIESAKMRKYQRALGMISSLPPSQCGSQLLMAVPIPSSVRLNTSAASSPRRTRFLAFLSSFAPMAWAICTVKPIFMAMHRPPKSQVVVETSPMDAAASEPRCPTIEASMYCMTIEEIWAKMAGRLSVIVRWISCLRDSASPFLSFSR